MSDYKKDSQIDLLVDYFRTNPGLMISVAYILLTLCGIIYSESYYGEFDIAILKLADITDFLTAGISDPAALLMFSGGLIVAWSFDKLAQYSFGVKSRWKNKPKSLSRTIVLALNYVPKSNLSVLVALMAIFVTYAFLFVVIYADWRGEDIKKGGGHKISVHTKLNNEAHTFTLLGSTTNYLLLYDTQTKLAKIVPIDYVTSLSPVIEKP